MDILGELMKKYPFYSPTISRVFYNDIFINIHLLVGETLFVCDANTQAIAKQYAPEGCHLLVLERPRAFPTQANLQKVLSKAQLIQAKHIFAFGTGAINDICKSASHTLNVTYHFVPTGLSMNGITSNNASIFFKGIKQSFQYKSPNIIYLEDFILLDTPRKFSSAGIMDSLSGYTAHNDFLYANTLDEEKYYLNEGTFYEFHKQMQNVLALAKEPNAHKTWEFNLALFELLYISGLIMNCYKSSIPFSGGEHHIAHTIEKRNPKVSEKFLHGEIISAILPKYSQMQMEYSKNDYIPHKTVAKNNSVDFAQIARSLDMPSHPSDIGISEEEFNICLKEAKHAKERPTLLSLLF